MDAFEISKNQTRLRRVRRGRIMVRVASLGFVLCFILLLMAITLQTAPKGSRSASAMEFPNQILKGSLSRAMRFGSGLKYLLPLPNEDSSVTEVKDTVMKRDSSVSRPQKVLGKESVS